MRESIEKYIKQKEEDINYAFLWHMQVQKMKHDIFMDIQLKSNPFANSSFASKSSDPTDTRIHVMFYRTRETSELGLEKLEQLMVELEDSFQEEEYFEWDDLQISSEIYLQHYTEANQLISCSLSKLFSKYGAISEENKSIIEDHIDQSNYTVAKEVASWQGGTKADEILFRLAVHRWKINYDQGYLSLAVASLNSAPSLPDDNGEAFRKYNLLALTYVDLGEFSLAVENHQKALQAIRKAGPKKVSKTDVANVYNALSYAYALNRQHDASYAASEQAETLYRQDDSDWGIGQCLSMRGRSRLEFNRVDSAKRNLEKALGDKYRLTMSFTEQVRVYLALAHVALLKDKLEEANNYLSKVNSKKLSNSRLLALYHQLSACRHYRESSKIRHTVLGADPWNNKTWLSKGSGAEYEHYIGWLHRSRQCFRKAIEANNKMGSDLYSIFASSGYVRTIVDELLTLEAKDDKLIRSLRNEVEDKVAWLDSLLKRHSDYESAWSPPLLWKQFGDYYAVISESNKSFDFYKKALPRIANNRMHEPFSILGQLKKIEDHILYFIYYRSDWNIAAVHEFGQILLDFWEEEYLFSNPEIAQVFANWASGDPRAWGSLASGHPQAWGGLTSHPPHV